MKGSTVIIILITLAILACIFPGSDSDDWC